MQLRRRGFTLAELLAATAVGGIAAALMTATIVRQQRIFTAASEQLSVRSELRDGADILAADIRGASVEMFGLPVMTDTAIEMVTVVGTSVACSAPSTLTIGLPPSVLVSGNSLTSMLVQPDTGDLALLYVAPPDNQDSAEWQQYRIASFTARALATACPSSTGFTTDGDSFSGVTGYHLTLTTPPAPQVRKGAPIHFLRRARYSFYRSSDGAWYLGYRRCGAAPPFACASIQPVSGPYQPYKSGASPGIVFRYFDSSGTELSDPSTSFNVARVEIVLRGESATAIAPAGDSRKVWRDSVVVTVSPRNRRW